MRDIPNCPNRKVSNQYQPWQLFLVIIASYCIASYYDTHYTNEATITRVEYHDDTNTIFALDEQGHVWEFKADNLACGQMVELKMFNNHTIAVEDDEVVGAKAVAVIH